MKADFVGLGYCSNDHLAVLPFIPMDTKVQMLKHAILGGGDWLIFGGHGNIVPFEIGDNPSRNR